MTDDMPSAKEFPGGGKNDRKAYRLNFNRWEPCEFEDLVPGNVACIVEADGRVAQSADGCCTQYIVSKPAQNTEGKWALRSVSCAELAALRPRSSGAGPGA